jgi:Flp pilus assembly protein TadB
MKIPTLFGRTPKHQKFSFEPRFYDPQKEEREERERRIRAEVENEKNKPVEGYESRIKGTFHSARKRSQATSSDLQISLIRIIILLFLVVFIVAYLQWGNKAFYGFLIFIPVYVWLKFKK